MFHKFNIGDMGLRVFSQIFFMEGGLLSGMIFGSLSGTESDGGFTLGTSQMMRDLKKLSAEVKNAPPQ